jgi:hypothetical protein
MEPGDRVGTLQAIGLFMLGVVGTIISLIVGVVWAVTARDRRQHSMAMCMSLGSVVGTVLVPVMAVVMYSMAQAPTP